jgi:hypothetical protein
MCISFGTAAGTSTAGVSEMADFKTALIDEMRQRSEAVWHSPLLRAFPFNAEPDDLPEWVVAWLERWWGRYWIGAVIMRIWVRV